MSTTARKHISRTLVLTPAQIRRFKAWAKDGGTVAEMCKSIGVKDESLIRAARAAGFDLKTGQDVHD